MHNNNSIIKSEDKSQRMFRRPMSDIRSHFSLSIEFLAI